MNRWMSISVVTILAIFLAACGGSPATGETPAAPAAGQAGTLEPGAAAILGEDYADALSLRNQLALGTLRLEGTPEAVTAEQASRLLPLWQVLETLSASTTSAPEEMEAVQNQLAASLTEAQVAAIAAMRLTNADLQAYFVEIGASEIRTPEPGVTPQGNSLKELPPEQREAARATAQALGTPVGGGKGGSGKNDVLLENVIDLLTERTGG
jgi:hypothetical protein